MHTAYRYGQRFLLALILCAGLLLPWLQPTAVAGQSVPAPSVATASTPSVTPFAFGAAVAHRDGERVAGMGFNWMLVYDPPHRREPVKVLYRLPLNHWSYNTDDDVSRWQFEDWLYRLVGEHGDWIDAYEIGNEVNLYVNGWEAPPNALRYVETLCTAYHIIKVMDPTALVVSAGLAPVGRVQGNWQGFSGHNYLTQEEREFFRAFLDEDGDECADVFGYHPLGFRADFAAEPDLNGGTPETNCENGFCFRGIEKIREIAVAFGKEQKPIWATEVGWIVEPNDLTCLDDYSWAGRQWQRVSHEKQAENLVGAFTYAHEHWPWLGGIFVFNLNFQEAPYYHACEQMRAYSIQGSATETALRGMIDDLFDFVHMPFIMQKGPAVPTTCANGEPMYSLLAENGNFSTLIKALDRTGVRVQLAGCGPFTLFAPTDAAFAALLQQFNLTETELLSLPELPEVLRYHLLAQRIPAGELRNGLTLTTVAGKDLIFSVNGATTQVNGANLLAADVAADNGLIHVIDAVLIPPAE